MLVVELVLVAATTVLFLLVQLWPWLRRLGDGDGSLSSALVLLIEGLGLAALWVVLVGRRRGRVEPYGSLLGWVLPIALIFGVAVALALGLTVLAVGLPPVPLVLIAVAAHHGPYVLRRIRVAR